jgi:hypothetical protein
MTTRQLQGRRLDHPDLEVVAEKVASEVLNVWLTRNLSRSA